MKTPGLSIALAPAGLVFAGVAKLRSLLYSQNILPSYDLTVPVVSVGNVTAGGTGKTPIIEALARGLTARGKHPAIVSRGYGGSEVGPARVPASEDSAASAAHFGDEPTWLARKLASTPVIVGRDRVAAGRWATANCNVDCLLADDAFQHRRLRRRYDVVVIDATEPLWHYFPLPMGRAREPLAAIGRAHAVVLNKVNLIDPEALATFRSSLQKVTASGALWIESEYRIRALVGRDGTESVPAPGLRVFSACGIGRPNTFRATLQTSLRCKIVGYLDFPDHQAFDARDFALIEAAAEKVQARAIVVSEKDSVKMAHWNPRVPLQITQLTAQPANGWDDLHDDVAQALN